MSGGASGARRVVMGRIRGPHGVKGWLRVQPFTEARESLLDYPLWMLGGGDDWRDYRLQRGSPHGSGLLVSLAGVADRDAAQVLAGSDVAVWRDELPGLKAGEFYWSDLEGLAVVTGDGVHLGVVERLFETGANDVVVVAGERERLIPFIMDDVVCRIDLEAGVMEVNWDPDF